MKDFTGKTALITGTSRGIGSSIKEILLDNQGRKYVEAILDGQDRVLEKNVYFYDDKGRVEEIKQYDMLRRGREGINEIPIRVNTYEYD